MCRDRLPWSAESEPFLRSALEALHRRAPTTPVLGMAGAVGCTCYCSLQCLCADRAEATRILLANAPRVGLELARNAGVAHIRSCAVARGPRSVRSALPLIEWCALLTRPPFAHRCRHGRRAVAAQGIAAYDAWLDDLARCVRLTRERRAGIEIRARSWTGLRREGARFLDWVAATRRSGASRHLRLASRHMLDEADGPLAVLSDLPRRDALRVAAESLSAARIHIEAGASALLKGALSLAGMDPALGAELATLGPSPPHMVAALVYLARTGVAPFRALAARRLGFADDAQALATLRQLAWDPDPLVAGTAQWVSGDGAPSVHAGPPTRETRR